LTSGVGLHMTWYARSASAAHLVRMRCAALIAVMLPLLAGAAGETAPPGVGPLLDRLPPSWREDRGKTLRLPELLGARIFVTMAYTNCHRICPMTMTHLEQLQRELDARGTSAEFLIVSYDPSNDDPAAWRRYRISHHQFRENWHFLTGTPADTERLARLLGFEFWHYDEHVMHDYRIVALGGDGALRGAIDAGHGEWRDLL
jgi:protein SCO1/2